MQYTPNLNLAKPGNDDDVSISVLNENMDILDAHTTYVFDFDIEPDGSSYKFIPREGVTYEKIRAALDITPNVFFRSYDDDLECAISTCTGYAEGFVSATGLRYSYIQGVGYVFIAFRARVNEDNTTDLVMTPLKSLT
jgi:hypothetical protein